MTNPTSVNKRQALLERALAHQQRGEFVQARALCRRLLSVQRRDFACLNLLGVIAGQQRQFRQAADWFAQALQVEPISAGAHANRGLALQELGDVSGALDCYERAIAIEPHFAEAHDRRGVLLQAQGRLHDALASLDTALAVTPGFAEGYSN